MEGSPQKAEWVTVSPGHAGQRVDNFLMARLRGVPKARIYRMLRKGEVRVNGGRCRPSQRLRDGDRVRIPPVTTQLFPPGSVPSTVEDQVARAILFEDAELAVLDKPAGLSVHAGSRTPYGIIEALQGVRPGTDWGLAHRLDRGTSGCLVVGKGKGTTRKLQEAFRQGKVTKVYLALLVGIWKGGDQLVEAPLRRVTGGGGQRRTAVDFEGGQPAITRFRLLRQFAEYSLTRAEPQTGRHHQIRVHARHLGHPVAGDTVYGLKQASADLKPRGLDRIFLHSAEIGFEHPVSGGLLHFQAPLPEELQAVLDRLASEPE